ncbi:MAG TPA: BON domain-containing protein [Pirellulaceae bacterium]
MPDTSRGLLDRIDHALRRTTQLTRHKFQFETSDGHVVVKGIVKSYFQKQMAQEVIRRVDGVDRVENRLEVVFPPVRELAECSSESM